MPNIALPRFLIGTVSVCLLIINLVALPLILFLFVLIKKIVPSDGLWEKKLEYAIQVTLPRLWTANNNRILALNPRVQWRITGEGTLCEKNWYVVISNHISTIDVLVLQRVFHRRVPHLKFVLKRELLWQLPFAGLACWCMGYPFVRRITKKTAKKKPWLKGQDIRDIEQACQAACWPTAFVCFLEGTRFNQTASSPRSSRFTHVLPPNISGFCVIQNSLAKKKPYLLNVTLSYEAEYGHTVSLLHFIWGRVRTVHVHYQVTPFNEEYVGQFDQDRAFRQKVRQYILKIWKEKDRLIEKIHHSPSEPPPCVSD